MSKKIIFILIIAGSLFQSCSDFLDLDPISSSTTGNSYNSPADIEAALVAAYSSLHNEFYTWDNVLLGDARSDNCYAGPPDDVDIFAYDMLTVGANNSRMFNNWRDFYLGISRANIVLLKIEEIGELENERKNQIIGEAKFLRAFYYFDLVKQYGGVPLMRSTGSADPDEIQIPRNSVQEVYDFIIEDLEDAITRLPISFDDNEGRATKGAANALLAKVWAQSPTRDYERTIQYCDAVINGGYSLVNDFESLFDGSNYNNSESIFEAQYLGGTPQGNWGPQLFLPPSISGDNWRKYATPSINIIDAFNAENDIVRLEACVVWEKPGWVDEYWSPTINLNDVPFVYKQKNANGWNSNDQVYFLRLADIILLKAEAMANLGQGDKGRSLLNMIRNRAGLGDSPASDSELAGAILKERRLELAFESHRWDDLVRNGTIVETMSNLQELNNITGEYVDYNMNENKILLPIPLQEIDRNPELKQNPGY
jgi:hypothetical protein